MSDNLKTKIIDSRTLDMPYTVIKEKTDTGLSAPLKSNLTQRIAVDTFLNFDGHVGEMILNFQDSGDNMARLGPRIKQEIDST